MDKKRRNSAVFIPLLLLLVACEIQGTPLPAARTAQPAAVIASSTPTEVTATLTPESEAQQLRDIVFSPCLAIRPEPPGGNQIPWMLLALSGFAPYAIDPNTGEMTDQLLPRSSPFSYPFPGDFAVSPDGEWLAYDLYGEDDVSLVVEPAANILTNRSEGRLIWRPSEPTGLEGWLSNENVMLVKGQSVDNFGSTLTYNPFTGEQHEFSLEEMPNSLKQQFGMSGSYLMDHGNLIPDPTLQRIVYPSWPTEDLWMVMVLWDVENKRALTSLRYVISLSRYSFWSQDGRDFLIAGFSEEESIEWFQVSREGAIHQLTRFGEFLKNVEFHHPSRSWDGRYLAFHLLYNDRKNSKYLILDLKSQFLDGFCLDSGGEESGSLAPPSWSPDSRFVAITHGSYRENSSNVILVDVEKREAFYIGKDIEKNIDATDWIVKP